MSDARQAARADKVSGNRARLDAGAVSPVVDMAFPLDEVPEAIRYLRDGRARGKVVITV